MYLKLVSVILSKKVVALVFISVTAFLFLGLSACTETSVDAQVEESSGPESVITVKVIRQDMVSEVTATGKVRPVRSLEIKSKASGEVLRFPVATGQIVKAGQILAQVDTTEAATSVRQRRAELDYQRAQLAVATDRKIAADEMLSKGVISRDQYNRDVLEHARVRSLIVSTEASLAQALERMAETTVRAPTAGTILEKMVEAGQIITSATSGVSEGTTLLRMADLTAVHIRVRMEQSNLGRLELGQEASITPDAYRDRRFAGRIEKIEPQSISRRDVTYFLVLIGLENQERFLLPGMDCSVIIRVSSKEDALTVSSDAVVSQKEARAIAPLIGVSDDQIDAALGSDSGDLDESLRSGIVFVLDSSDAGVRPVIIRYGLRDWNLTDVRTGLVEEMVAIVPPNATVVDHFRRFEERLKRAGVKFPGKLGNT